MLYELTRGAISLLHLSLSQPGWAKTPPDIYRAGNLAVQLEDLFTDVAPQDPDPTESAKQFNHWANRLHSVQVDDQTVPTVKACLTEIIGAGKLAPSRHSASLTKAFGLT